MAAKRVLVVDDDRMMVRTLCDILAAHGWQATGVHSGEDGVRAVGDESFDAVLMDVRMEGINGVHALREMKRLRPAIRVILMTAYTAADLLEQAEREGALRILAKPVAIPGLLQMLDSDLADGGASRRVLVIDDNPQFLSTICTVLERSGYAVYDAKTLEEAVETLQAKAPTVVLLDLRLDGVEIEDSLLAIKLVSPAVAVILYSGQADVEQVRSRVPTAWIHACLQKPFAPTRLIGLLDDIFS